VEEMSQMLPVQNLTTGKPQPIMKFPVVFTTPQVGEEMNLAGSHRSGCRSSFYRIFSANHMQVWEEMNLAYSAHEIIADFATAAFVWLEGG